MSSEANSNNSDGTVSDRSDSNFDLYRNMESINADGEISPVIQAKEPFPGASSIGAGPDPSSPVPGAPASSHRLEVGSTFSQVRVNLEKSDPGPDSGATADDKVFGGPDGVASSGTSVVVTTMAALTSGKNINPDTFAIGHKLEKKPKEKKIKSSKAKTKANKEKDKDKDKGASGKPRKKRKQEVDGENPAGPSASGKIKKKKASLVSTLSNAPSIPCPLTL
jgi:hypothetical protein